MRSQHNYRIIVLDCGGQYAHLLASKVRRCGAYSEIRDATTSLRELKGIAGIILSGGPQSVYALDSLAPDPNILKLGVPVLAICYGAQWLAHRLGGRVKQSDVHEYGGAKVKISNNTCPILRDVGVEFEVWMSHGDQVDKLPDALTPVGATSTCPNAAFMDLERSLFGLQFHPEVTHTQGGGLIIKSFVELCAVTPWSVNNYLPVLLKEIRKVVGNRSVFMLVSGGVDSTVAFALLNKVLGKARVEGWCVETGLMRLGEVAKIRQAFVDQGITNFQVLDAGDKFFQELGGVIDPEKKRAIIGRVFVEMQKIAGKNAKIEVDGNWMLGQGTIYPDTIESGGTRHASRIKTHHNRAAEIEALMQRGLVVEPLTELYKDEVRELGVQLGLPHHLVWRHPFPGPGLGVRILCSDGSVPEEASIRLDIKDLHQILPVRSVGVQGDKRTYKFPLALFCADKTFYVPEHFWGLANEIPNTNTLVSRVVVCVSHTEPPTSYVLTPTSVTRPRADLLRGCEAIVNDVISSHDLYDRIWQFPVVLLPFGFQSGGESIVLRPVDSIDAMTASTHRLSDEVLREINERLINLSGIDCVFYDLTSKPPGTIEWE